MGAVSFFSKWKTPPAQTEREREFDQGGVARGGGEKKKKKKKTLSRTSKVQMVSPPLTGPGGSSARQAPGSPGEQPRAPGGVAGVAVFVCEHVST